MPFYNISCLLYPAMNITIPNTHTKPHPTQTQTPITTPIPHVNEKKIQNISNQQRNEPALQPMHMKKV